MSNFWNNIFHKFSIPKSNFGRQENEKCSIVLATYNPYNPQKAYNIQEFLKFYTKDFNK